MAQRVLLADDSPHARRMGCVYLEDLGCQVTAVADGASALAAIERESPELILTAAELPGLSGRELCRQVKARWRGITVLILVGGMAAADLAAWPGADGVLRKPLSSAGLETWLRKSPQQMLLEAVREAARAGLDPAAPEARR